MLEIEDLTIELPDMTVQIPDLKVGKGDVFVLLGPTGAGKSTFLEVVSGFLPAQRGRILVEGRDVTHDPPDRRGISILFQEPYLFPHLNVAGNIRYANQDPAIFEELVNLLDLRPHLLKSAGMISGGERQLVAVARALMARPQVLLLDEAFRSIDPQFRRVVLNAFGRVQQRFRMTSVVVTHNFEEALFLGRRLGVMIQGRLTQTGAPEEVFLQPASAEVARFLGIENLFSGQFERLRTPAPGDLSDGDQAQFPALFKTDSLQLYVLTEQEGQGYALVHPRDITLSTAKPLRSSALNQLKGRITGIATHGAINQLQVDAGLPFIVFITPQSCRDLGLSTGSEVYLSFKAAAVKTYSLG